MELNLGLVEHIWSTFDLIAFKVIFGSVSAFVSKLISSNKWKFLQVLFELLFLSRAPKSMNLLFLALIDCAS